MVNAVKAFRKIQISGPEATLGTAIPAVEVMCGVLKAPYGDKVFHFPEQDKGILSKHKGDSFTVQREVEISYEAEANARQCIWAFSNSIRGNVTPTQPASTLQPLAYQWSFQPGITTGNTPDITNGIDTFTTEFGDNVGGKRAEYCFTRSLEFVGAPNEAVMMTQEITGRQITDNAFTAALATVNSQYFPAGLTKFYIDSSYANIGTTQITGLLRGWTWKLETAFTPRYTSSDGLLVFSGVSEDWKNVELELIFLRDSTNSEAEKVKYDTNAPSYMRIEMNGATELDAGQGNVPQIQFDMAVEYSEWPEPDDEDGAVVIAVTAQSVYDSVAAMEYEVTVRNELDAYPT